MTNHASRLTIRRVHPFLGARVEGVDLAEPMDEPTFRAIFDAFPPEFTQHEEEATACRTT